MTIGGTFSVLALGLDGLLAGTFIGSAMVEHAARRLSGSHWIAYKQAKEPVFGPAMPVFFGGCLIVTVGAAAIGATPIATGIATALLAVVLAITVTIHLPLNRLFMLWSPDEPPVGWDAGRRRWRVWNLVRTILAVIAFVVLVAAGV